MAKKFTMPSGRFAWVGYAGETLYIGMRESWERPVTSYQLAVARKVSEVFDALYQCRDDEAKFKEELDAWSMEGAIAEVLWHSEDEPGVRAVMSIPDPKSVGQLLTEMAEQLKASAPAWF